MMGVLAQEEDLVAAAAAHSSLTSLYGAICGVLAYWRGSIRPGMIAHAWQDSLNGVLASLTTH